MQAKRILIFLLLAVCLANFNPTKNFAQISESELTDFVCEVGIKFYKNGRFSEALKEFQTVLTIDPENETAKRYIDLITNQIAAPIAITPSEEQKPPEQKPTQDLSPAERIFPEAKKDQSLDEFMQKMEKELKGEVYVSEEESAAKKAALIGQEALPKVLVLDVQIKNIKFPLEIEQEKSVIVRGINIRRFLITQPEVLSAERINTNEVKFTGKGLGYTYAHIWDEQERWTLEFLTVPLRPTVPTLAEEFHKEEEKSRNFKLGYSFDWMTFKKGRRADSLKTLATVWNHTFNLAGPVDTPYGDLSFGFTVGATEDTADLTTISAALDNGKIGPFRDFSLHAFDFNPNIQNLTFSTQSLRGVAFESPAFNKIIDYSYFWGREGGTRYFGLTTGSSKLRHSFLEGLNFNFYPQDKQKYNLFAYHGWGQDRLKDLHPYGYDFNAKYNFDRWRLGYEVGYDTEEFAYRLKTNYRIPRLELITEFRDTAKDFKTNAGLGPSAGEIGLLNNLYYNLLENVNLSAILDVFKDRLFPRPGDPNILNENFNSTISWQIDPLTNSHLNYNLQNYLGKLSPYRYYSAGIGLARIFEWIKRLSTHINYNYTVNRNFFSPSSDYTSNKILAGIRFNLIHDIGYFFDQEYAWVEALSVDEFARPRAFQTGVDWGRQIFKSPFYTTLRFMYRDEENTLSPFSFMSGEDYIEGYGEINFRPVGDFQAYFNTRVRNIWADNPKVEKRIEVSVYSGLRYIWDTGLSWEATGTIEGYVFKDLNGDGLRQRDEAPIQGVKIWVGKSKFQVTDVFGYYKFKRVKARKVYVSVDMTTVPAGFVLTGPMIQEMSIVQGKKLQANFGIVSRTEIAGMVFEDIDGDGQFSAKDSGLRDVVLRLENGQEATTDDYGRYLFRKEVIGKHRVSLDLQSLPAMYLPTVPIYRDVEIAEGMTYNYNIPVKKIEK